jgi:enediyne core biosynthesis thioesterase
MDQYYEYRHVVDAEETSHAGNVFHVNCVRWQGRCREMFLLEYVPSMLDELRGDLMLATVESGCEYLAGIEALDELSIRMRLEELTRSQIGFVFDYVRIRDGAEELVARGWQRVACMRRADAAIAPVPVPEPLRLALDGYAVSWPQRTGSVRLGAGGRA